jgi:hypothetical protein
VRQRGRVRLRIEGGGQIEAVLGGTNRALRLRERVGYPVAES